MGDWAWESRQTGARGAVSHGSRSTGQGDQSVRTETGETGMGCRSSRTGKGKQGDLSWGSRYSGARGAGELGRGEQGLDQWEQGLDQWEQGLDQWEQGLDQWEQDYWAMGRRQTGPGEAGGLGQVEQGDWLRVTKLGSVGLGEEQGYWANGSRQTWPW
jgi:hypothetical protein